jgi:hypothetical protein
MTTDIVQTAIPEWEPYRGQTYGQLIQDAGIVPGADLVKGDAIIGVPFVTTAVTFRIGDYASAVTRIKGAYANIEIVTGDDAAFARAVKRGRIPTECDIEPMEELIFNEGGTGVYRQLVSAWLDLGWIQLPEGELGGAYGESILDTPLDEWLIVNAGPVVTTADSEGNPVYSAATRLLVKRGLRVSEYENDFTKEGRTRYLA